jgi:hypothetical protein
MGLEGEKSKTEQSNLLRARAVSMHGRQQKAKCSMGKKKNMKGKLAFS